MGQPSRPADLGSRRAMVLTLVVSVLLLVGGLVILHWAGTVRLGQPTPPTPSVSTSTRATTSGP
jgi:hypothetical protein